MKSAYHYSKEKTGSCCFAIGKSLPIGIELNIVDTAEESEQGFELIALTCCGNVTHLNNFTVGHNGRHLEKYILEFLLWLFNVGWNWDLCESPACRCSLSITKEKQTWHLHLDEQFHRTKEHRSRTHNSVAFWLHRINRPMIVDLVRWQ